MTNRQLVLVIGVPRSGTTALFDALSASPGAVAYHEPDDSPGRRVVDDPIYFDERLRPEPQIRECIRSAPGPVLLRPMEELADRSLDDVFAEYADHDLHVVWIYRDAAKVLGSAVARGWWEPTRRNIERATAEWNRRNRLVLACCESALTVVRYEDLAADPRLVTALGDRLGLLAAPTFGADLGRGLDRLPPDEIERIRSATAEVRRQLDGRRTPLPVHDGRPGAPPAGPVSRPVPSVRELLRQASGPEAEPLLPPEVAGLRLWLDPAGLDATPAGVLTAWSSPRPGLPDGRVASGAPEPGGGALRFPRRQPDVVDLVEVGEAADWGFTATSDFTALVVLALPDDPAAVWGPIVTTGSPSSGGPGWSILWLGPATGSRPTPTPGASADAQPFAPTSGVLAACITRRRDRPPTSLLHSHLAVTVAADPAFGPWTVVVCRHRVLSAASELSLAVTASGTLVTGGPGDPDAAFTPTDGLTIGAARGPVAGYPGAVAEVQVFDRFLDDGDIAGLVRDLARRHPRLGLVGAGRVAEDAGSAAHPRPTPSGAPDG